MSQIRVPSIYSTYFPLYFSLAIPSFAATYVSKPETYIISEIWYSPSGYNDDHYVVAGDAVILNIYTDVSEQCILHLQWDTKFLQNNVMYQNIRRQFDKKNPQLFQKSQIRFKILVLRSVTCRNTWRHNTKFCTPGDHMPWICALLVWSNTTLFGSALQTLDSLRFKNFGLCRSQRLSGLKV